MRRSASGDTQNLDRWFGELFASYLAVYFPKRHYNTLSLHALHNPTPFTVHKSNTFAFQCPSKSRSHDPRPLRSRSLAILSALSRTDTHHRHESSGERIPSRFFTPIQHFPIAHHLPASTPHPSPRDTTVRPATSSGAASGCVIHGSGSYTAEYAAEEGNRQ